MAHASLLMLGLIAGAVYVTTQGQAGPDEAQQDNGQGLDNIANNAIEELENMTQNNYIAQDVADRNTSAFLQMLRYAEGTAGPNGYRTLFGGSLFTGFDDHPRIAKQFTSGGRTLWTSAAGAYQFMAVSRLPNGNSTRVNTWDRIQHKLGLLDFSPASQDRAAVALIDEAGALNDVQRGNLRSAISKTKGIWASLPGAGYSQPERSFASLADVYHGSGGTFA